MSIARTAAPWAATLARGSNIFLFSLNLAWIATWYLLEDTVLGRELPLWGDEVRVFNWRIWMPEPGEGLRLVVYWFALCVPLSLVLLWLARVSLAGAYLRAIAGAFALTGFPFLALKFNNQFLQPRYLGHTTWLILEVMAVLALGVLYYLRRSRPSVIAIIILLLAHFGFWARVTGKYAPPMALVRAFPAWCHMPALEMIPRVCIMMIYHNAFPVIGFLSAFSSAVDLKLASRDGRQGALPPIPLPRSRAI